MFRLYYDACRCSYGFNIGVNNLGVARAREPLRYLSVFRLCQLL